MFCFDCEHEWEGSDDEETCPNCGSGEISWGGSGDPDDEEEWPEAEETWEDEDDEDIED